MEHFELLESSSCDLIDLDNCEKCDNTRITVVEGKRGYLEAVGCSCTDLMPLNRRGGWNTASQRLQNAEIPNRYLPAASKQGVNQELLDWLDKSRLSTPPNRFLFFYGGVGTGKTHSAIHTLFAFFKDSKFSIIYLPTYKFIETRRRYLDERFSDDKKAKAQATIVFNHYRDQIRNCDVIVLDELGQEKLHPDESKILFELLDSRYSSGKITICISNHCDDKNRSLDGKSLSSLVGARIASRLKSAHQIFFSGDDKRIQEGSEVISKEEIESFMVPSKILTHDADTHQIMTWLTRNPAFETVSTARRNELTHVLNDLPRDMDRDTPSVFSDVWIEGDRLTVTGPICDHEDKKLYAILLKELANLHGSNQSGLKLEISYRKILELQGLFPGGDQIERLRRQLDRLVRMHLNFQSKNRAASKWAGPLISALGESGNGPSRKTLLFFNPFMISFYRASAYTSFSRALSEKLIGDGSSFYLFFVSHDRKNTLRPIPFEKCKKLLGMPDQITRKAALRRISNATKDLISFNVLSPSSKFKNDALYPVPGNALSFSN